MRLKDEHKEWAIRQQAIEMIVNECFDGFSMHKLAKKVKISVSTIYVYFKNREDLVNKLYIEIQSKFEKDVLNNFNTKLNFEDGLWLQWKNRLDNITRNPLEYLFYEQFRNSPLINHKDIKPAVFRKAMNDFVNNAIHNKQLVVLSPEVYWALAYGPFYTLVKFDLNKATMAGKSFSLTEEKLRHTFELVIKALKP